MVLQGVAEGAGGYIPEAYGVVAAAAGQGLRVGTEHHAVDLVRVALQCVAKGTCGCIPEAYGVVAAAAGQGLRVGAERHAQDPSRMPCEQRHSLAGVGIVKPDVHAAPNRQPSAIR